MRRNRLLISAALLSVCAIGASAQTKWYKFDKKFTENNFPSDSAIGELHASESHPSSVHQVSCGGKDGELHAGVPAGSILRSNSSGLPVSGPQNAPDSDFGIVAEPPNATSQVRTKLLGVQNNEIIFTGYYRLWNEGHDVGPIAPKQSAPRTGTAPSLVVRLGRRQLRQRSRHIRHARVSGVWGEQIPAIARSTRE